MSQAIPHNTHAICDYEGTSYRADFWEGHGREYEDLAERAALRRLLPPRGHRILEVGAGFARLADLYAGYEQVVLLDHARSGLQEAQARLGVSGRFLYVAADLYHLPLVPAACDTIVSVRVLHHIADIPAALSAIAAALRPGGAYVLEFANKRNLKAIGRYFLRRQSWSPFTREPYEFATLNYDFHPAWMARALAGAGFTIDAQLAVSHFRHPLLKRLVPAPQLAALDARLQRIGAAWKLTPSVFLRGLTRGHGTIAPDPLFCCPRCLAADLRTTQHALACTACGAAWDTSDGIYDFRAPLPRSAAQLA